MRKTISLAMLVGAVVVVSVVWGGLFGHPAPAEETSARTAAPQDPDSLAQLRDFAGKLETLFQTVARRVSPAVVAIEAESTVRVPAMEFRNPFEEFFFGDPFFRDFNPFGNIRPRQRTAKRRVLGSGVIFDKEGYILTNNHVVAGADQLTVTLPDGRKFDATIAGTDKKTELAVIKIKGDAKDLPVAKLGDSSHVKVGQWVLAIGNPFGLTHTVSAGIVSATGRSGLGVAEYESMIQTDAAINPGNSGGPLVNLKCEVIGINTAIVGRSGNIGIGFAIPINMATAILDDLMHGRQIVRGYMGVDVSDLTSDLAKEFGYKGVNGALVHEVRKGSPAERAGFKAGDIVLKYNGRDVRNANDLQQLVLATRPGTRVEVVVWRDGKEKTLTVKVGNLSEVVETASDWLGLQVQTLTKDMARQMGRPDLKGVIVTDVDPDSRAASVISPGDVIVSVNRQPVPSVAEYQQAMSRARDSREVLLRVLDGQTGRFRFVLIRGGH